MGVQTLTRMMVVLLTNKTGGSVAQGDVVVVDPANATAFKSTTTSGYNTTLAGVVLDASIANNAIGMVCFAGYVPKVNLSASASLGDFFKTHTVAKQAVPHATHADVDFGQVLQTGTSPAAVLFGRIQKPHRWQFIFTVEGNVTVRTGAVRIGNDTGAALTILKVSLRCGTAPATTDLIVDVNKNGTTIFTTQANRPKILAGQNAGNSVAMDVTSLADGDYLTMDIDQIGVGTVGADLSVSVVCE